jgi:hypothetical protein
MVVGGVITDKRPNPRNRKKLTKQRGSLYSAAAKSVPSSFSSSSSSVPSSLPFPEPIANSNGMLSVQSLSYEQFQYYTALEKKGKEELKAEVAKKRKEGVMKGVKEVKERVKMVSEDSAERPLKKKRY